MNYFQAKRMSELAGISRPRNANHRGFRCGYSRLMHITRGCVNGSSDNYAALGLLMVVSIAVEATAKKNREAPIKEMVQCPVGTSRAWHECS